MRDLLRGAVALAVLLAVMDGRSAPARRYKEVAAAIAVDLGGPDHLSEAQLQLIRTSGWAGRFAGQTLGDEA